MYYITVEDSFDSAHFLSGYDGKCRNIHGHRWKVVVTVKSSELSDEKQTRGMVIDFGRLKKILKNETQLFDHSVIIETGSLDKKILSLFDNYNFNVCEVNFRPTAENFAKYFYDKIKLYCQKVYSVDIYETPNNRATYKE